MYFLFFHHAASTPPSGWGPIAAALFSAVVETANPISTGASSRQHLSLRMQIHPCTVSLRLASDSQSRIPRVVLRLCCVTHPCNLSAGGDASWCQWKDSDVEHSPFPNPDAGTASGGYHHSEQQRRHGPRSCAFALCRTCCSLSLTDLKANGTAAKPQIAAMPSNKPPVDAGGCGGMPKSQSSSAKQRAPSQNRCCHDDVSDKLYPDADASHRSVVSRSWVLLGGAGTPPNPFPLLRFAASAFVRSAAAAAALRWSTPAAYDPGRRPPPVSRQTCQRASLAMHQKAESPRPRARRRRPHTTKWIRMPQVGGTRRSGGRLRDAAARLCAGSLASSEFSS